MKTLSKWVLAVGLAVAAVSPAAAQPYGYGDDDPPPFRRGPGWDGPPRWERWHHHRRWGDERGFERRGWRDDDRDGGGRRFGDEGRRRFGNDNDGGDGRGQRGGRQGNRDADAQLPPRQGGAQRGWSGPHTE